MCIHFSDDNSLSDRIEDIKNKLNHLEATLQNVDKDVDETDVIVQAAEKNTTDITANIEKVLGDIQV